MNLQLLHDSLAEKDRRSIYEIARDRYHLHGISLPGLFDWVQESRHYIGPLEALPDNRVREVNILKPVRGGGSVIGDLFLLWALDNDPGNYMQVLQTDDEVSQYVSNRTIANLEKSLPELLPNRYTRGEGEIKLNNSHSLYISGPGISNMQTKMIRYMHLDEPWMYAQGTIGEAQGRMGDFKRVKLSKLLCISQAGPLKGSLDDCDWYHQYQKGEQNEWHVRCLGCGKLFPPIFTGRREDDSFWGVT